MQMQDFSEATFSNPQSCVHGVERLTPISNRIAIYKDGRRQPIDCIGVFHAGRPSFFVANDLGEIQPLDTIGLVRVERVPLSAWLEAGQHDVTAEQPRPA